MRDKTFLVMAGGTGGHVFPALATAKKLMSRNDKVVWLGSVGGMEERVVQDAGIPFYGISVSGVRGKGILSKALAPLKIAKAVFQALLVLRKTRPDAVLGMGGFASGPGGLAAKLLGKPLLVHEQNAVAGMTNKVLAKMADSVMSAFPEAFEDASKVVLTGNPLRDEICELFYSSKDSVSKSRPIRVLVLGGSLGAARLNEVLPGAMSSLGAEIRPEIWHQTGRNKSEGVAASYEKYGVKAQVSEFIDDMAAAYRWADFVICRAGALTISELCVAGLGAILIPYPHAVDDHQTLNAQYMTKGGAAWLLDQQDLSESTLSEVLAPLFSKPERISILSEAARKLAKADATENVASECRRVCYA
ncbi:UDP-N-acetylglucosamine--N-acetylmuramyl-(pentapeptide) pyrophosphoryl-undecaprenol N-acetylglucosamine transferase [Oleiphilus sp. HI0068]|jgi:UDP-N-acetylglucosamine--N-acetylmuramyl-(pentapeptide) pyrophosphoryl-undecaprenol N-acetylglucosamine transferase|uniref:undecaprenyldiphospho-muramoylpentapeptide beta-N-acetylglucosaminyltransferase n=3 Tax=Oleiphilus TaxID=141450 RepID=UPI0007C26C5E|nr:MULTISPECIES: undecaprenyldiphospho-muramoylpentapeptide beta-N-acetylglucosaminyltransferase [unclassified Oleiphilus]KZY75498.1 UDP-N-acetylglucosamine--N-acetylmuramyl-(pentapeptide) pyrophosphoryl-undecaprenol N-acetylglucosamine transferase [Oleiphilus sp. HI0069]KZY78169.1 UDP-N-acetylglucosamine--N-acetylmuramyl-(pentapeptide) pyrophosphoryl-undecaprenol N-acetylglucosamine transferase [Oleiphilus sp. HI0068]KZZ34000.1 UDP-N-acetylglucosamine--N-acetylmuramyl-(pentapeptide) pyrophospho